MNITNLISFIPVRSDNGTVDIEGCLIAAKKAAEEFAAKDDPLTAQIGEAAIKVWDQEKFSGLKYISSVALGRMALTALDIIPDQQAIKDADRRVKTALSGQPDRFIVLKAGPKRGIHYKSRYSEGELALLTAQK